MISCLLAAIPAQAQSTYADDPTPPSGRTSDDDIIMLGDFTVTAEKTGEKSAQRTPLSISVVGEDLLKSNVVPDATGLTNYVPNVQIGKNGTAVEIAVRGISSSNNTEVGNPAVGFLVDGVGYGRPQAAAAAFYDLERVEILRGPQGTLYGRNTIAGSINVITKKPRPELAGAVDVSFGNYNYLKTEGMVNVPLSRTLAMRAAFQTNRRDGYVSAMNSLAGVPYDYDRVDNRAARLQTLFTPSERFSVLLSLDYFNDKGSATNIVLRPLDNSEPERRLDARLPNEVDNTYKGAQIEANADLGKVRLTYLGSYREAARDEANVVILGQLPNPVILGAAFEGREDERSHELRFSSGVGGRLEWVGGLYSYSEHNGLAFVIPGINLGFIQPYVRESSLAAFGQATYKLNDRMRLTVGLRETRDAKRRSGGQFSVSSEGQPLEQLSDNFADNSWSSFNWKAGFEYDLGPQSMVYSTAATGYKAGGYSDGIDLYYEPEELTSFELGIKNRFLDSRLQVNLATFYYSYENFQVSDVQVNPQTGSLGTLTRNIQKMPVYGAELETSYLLSPNDRIDFNLSHLNTRFDTFFYNQRVNGEFITRDLEGNRLAKAPKWSTQLSYEHTFRLPNDGILVWRINSRWVSGYYTSFDNHPLAPAPVSTWQKSFTKSDTMLRYEPSDRSWFVEAFVKNIENNVVWASSNSTGATGSLEPPRTWGIRGGAKF